VSDIALAVSALPKKNAARPRIVVITQGAEPTLVATAGAVTAYPVPKVDDVVDTNGARSPRAACNRARARRRRQGRRAGCRCGAMTARRAASAAAGAQALATRSAGVSWRC
jgi:hypothetical protein